MQNQQLRPTPNSSSFAVKASSSNGAFVSRKTGNWHILYFFLPVLLLFIPQIESFWQTESYKFEIWRISSIINTQSDSLIVGGELVYTLGNSTRSPNSHYYKAGFKNIKVYLKDTILTLSFDTVDLQMYRSKKVTSVKNTGGKKIKIELEAILNDGSNIIDTTFTTWNYKKIKTYFVFQYFYQLAFAWIFVLTPGWHFTF